MGTFPGIVLLTCMAMAQVAAQTPAAPAAVKTMGDITAVDADAKTVQLKTSAGVTWSVTLTEKTVCVSVPAGEKDLKKATPIALPDIKPGDRMLARGEAGSGANTLTAASVIVITKAELAQKHERDKAEWQRRSVAGTVSAVDAGKNEIAISTQSRDGAKAIAIQVSAATQYRRYAADSVKFADAKPSALAEIQVGDQVRALGDKNDDGTRVTAEEIVSGAFRTFAGTVVSADAASRTVRVTDLQTNKPVTVHVKDDTLARTLPGPVAAMLAQRIRGGAAGGGGTPGGGGAGQWQRGQGNGAGWAGGGGGTANGQGGQGGWNRGAGGPGAAGGAGGAGGPGGRGQWDMQQMLERMPPLVLADLKKGDALVISSSRGSNPADITALTLLAGVEPLLTAAPRMAGGSVNAGNWNLDIGMPGMPTE